MSDIHLIPMNETVEQTYERGYTQALADAKAAVVKIEGIPYKLGYEEKAWIERADALAAIESLEVPGE